MDLRKLKTLLTLMRKYDLVEMELEEEGEKVRLRKGGPLLDEPAPRAARTVSASAAPAEGAAAPPAKPAEKEKPALLEITAPIVGTFYRSPKPGDPPFCEEGTRVQKGATVCIVEAMKVMNEIKSEFEGVVEEILVENGAAVEYGQVLIRLRP